MTEAVAHIPLHLPGAPHDLWASGELVDYMPVSSNKIKVEIIGGEILVSPVSTVAHNAIVAAVTKAVFVHEFADPAYPWRTISGSGLNLYAIGDGYIPDLIVLDAETLDRACRDNYKHLLPHQVGMVVEVTSPSNAVRDRAPGQKCAVGTKWSGYAKVGVPFYLLVDRDPRVAEVVLFDSPDPSAGTYQPAERWPFGEVVRLPEPFGFEINTSGWQPWGD